MTHETGKIIHLVDFRSWTFSCGLLIRWYFFYHWITKGPWICSHEESSFTKIVQSAAENGMKEAQLCFVTFSIHTIMKFGEIATSLPVSRVIGSVSLSVCMFYVCMSNALFSRVLRNSSPRFVDPLVR